MNDKYPLSQSFLAFFHSEKASGILLLICTALSLFLSNSSWSASYLHWWHSQVGGHALEMWINDGLMAIFFLLIGLELERELYSGELSRWQDALLPIIAAVGGTLIPALLHFSLNNGTATQAGIGIPMATDIAFALGVIALLGKRVPNALKVFVVAFAVMDDLCAIIVIALFYTAQVHFAYLLAAILIWLSLLVLNFYFHVKNLTLYLAAGCVMWVCMWLSGVHATIAGVLLAFAIPYSSAQEGDNSPSQKLERALHLPVAFAILPLFALANTAIAIGNDWLPQLTSMNSLGIIAGLSLGKPIGIMLFCFIAVHLQVATLPPGLQWPQLFGAGILGGIGFTMSIFIANLAFSNQLETVNSAKLAILLASLLAGLSGFLYLRFTCPLPHKVQ
jgi:NhaA family Na+:H+ antiporter